ncbi:hypothetical protein KP509_28G021600 [Ceratopteris richardii]|nr:hypothetical protein KP509_28G021600 [Ceratopteris richardii]
MQSTEGITFCGASFQLRHICFKQRNGLIIPHTKYSSSRRRSGEFGVVRHKFHIHAANRNPLDGRSDDSEKVKTTDIPSLKVAEVSALENGALLQSRGMMIVETNDQFWEQVDTGLRITYALGVYGAMALIGQTICYFMGIDRMGGLDLSIDAVMQGVGYAVPPVLALLFILDDEVVKKSHPARAIRDVEDAQLMSFWVGLSWWQVMLVVSMAAIAEEFFFRVGIQGGLAHVFLSDDKVRQPLDGITALTGMFPVLAPFAHALAAVLTASITGSILFITSFPQDPKYVVAPVNRSRSSLQNLKQSFAAWYERRQLRRIYSPLLESFLALYIGFEWIQAGNILAPIITHAIYSSLIVGNGVRRIHDQRKKLRERTQCLRDKSMDYSKNEPDERI